MMNLTAQAATYLTLLASGNVHAEDLHGHEGNFFEQFWAIFSDPAHALVEVSYMIILDVLILGLLWPLVRKFINSKIRAAHREIDAEHGVDHDSAHETLNNKED